MVQPRDRKGEELLAKNLLTYLLWMFSNSSDEYKVIIKTVV